MKSLVCIAAAGTGSRLGPLTRNLSKAMIEVGGKPVISRIIDQFPEETRFVVALGYQGAILREYLQIAHPRSKFEFFEVNPFEGQGSGLGLSLLCCERALQEPFIFTSCDTLVEESIPPADSNWVGYATADILSAYRTLRLSGQQVAAIEEKSTATSRDSYAYIGLAGIHDVEQFWYAMREGSDQAIQEGEAYGLKALLKKESINAHRFSWHDTGTPESLAKTRQRYQSSMSAHILEKDNEAIWFLDDLVIKFSTSENFINNRVKRAQLLSGYVPMIEAHSTHFYCYKRAQGDVLSSKATVSNFEGLLNHAEVFWAKRELSAAELVQFQQSCKVFYRDKTVARVKDFFSRYKLHDQPLVVNGNHTPSVIEQLNSLNWDDLVKGIPSRFHGDFHFENILIDEERTQFTLLDWRQDFAGDLEIGDIYYDLAKLLHGLIVNHKIVTNEHYWIEWIGNRVNFDIYRSHRLVACEDRFRAWLVEHGYEVKKVYDLCAIVFLNIAPLHHDPYARLLFALGKSMLARQI